jgi:F-type H+-transporting ATPase subunit b
MFALFTFLLADAANGSFAHWWQENGERIANFPGFQLWRFLNLAIFLYILYRLLRTPLSGAFKAKREAIRAELIKAEEERQAAVARLTEMEAKLARLETERGRILESAAKEASLEKSRIIEQTETEISKLRTQVESETARMSKQANYELRKYSAEESIRLAEQKIKATITPETDARLVRANIQSIGGAR